MEKMHFASTNSILNATFTIKTQGFGNYNFPKPCFYSANGVRFAFCRGEMQFCEVCFQSVSEITINGLKLVQNRKNNNSALEVSTFVTKTGDFAWEVSQTFLKTTQELASSLYKLVKVCVLETIIFVVSMFRGGKPLNKNKCGLQGPTSSRARATG